MGKLRHLAFGLILIAAFFAPGARAQTNLTQIRDTVYSANGTPFNGTVTITWTGSSTGLSGSGAPLSTSARIYNGTLSVLVVPTTSAVPGTFYQALYVSNDGLTMWTETWQVPPRMSALTIVAVRISSTAGGTTGAGGGGSGGVPKYATLPIAMSDVTNLNSSLSQINTSLQSLTNTSTSLNSTVTGLSSSFTSLSSNLTGVSNTVSGLSSTVTGLGSSFSNLSGNVAGIGNTVNGLSTTVTGLGSSFTTLNNAVGGVTNTVNGLTSTVSGLGSTVGSHGNTLMSLNNTVGGLTSNVNTLTATVNQLSSTLSNSVAFVDAEAPVGIVDGTNSVFTLSQTPTPVASVEIYRNGLVQASGVDYSVTGSTIHFMPVSLPQPGDLIQAYYRISGSSVTFPSFSDNESPTGLVDGSNVTFRLANAPSPQQSLKLYKNGMLLQQRNDYAINGNVLTFVQAATPQPGDSIATYYRR